MILNCDHRFFILSSLILVGISDFNMSLVVREYLFTHYLICILCDRRPFSYRWRNYKKRYKRPHNCMDHFLETGTQQGQHVFILWFEKKPFVHCVNVKCFIGCYVHSHELIFVYGTREDTPILPPLYIYVPHQSYTPKVTTKTQVIFFLVAAFSNALTIPNLLITKIEIHLITSCCFAQGNRNRFIFVCIFSFLKPL